MIIQIAIYRLDVQSPMFWETIITFQRPMPSIINLNQNFRIYVDV